MSDVEDHEGDTRGEDNELDEKETVAATAADTITPDATDFSIKHPLQYKWTMHYNPPEDWKAKAILSTVSKERILGLVQQSSSRESAWQKRKLSLVQNRDRADLGRSRQQERWSVDDAYQTERRTV